MHNTWTFGLGALLACSGVFVTVGPAVSANPAAGLGAFTSPTPNSSYRAGDTITIRITQSGPMQRQSGSAFSAVMFTSDSGCVTASAFGTVYTTVNDREIVVTTPVLPDVKPGPCTITGREQDGARDAESVVVNIVGSEPSKPSAVAGAEVTNAGSTTVPEVSSITVTPGGATTTTGIQPPQVAGVTIAPNQTLPRTGTSTIAQTWLGMMLLGLGAVFTALARRSRRDG